MKIDQLIIELNDMRSRFGNLTVITIKDDALIPLSRVICRNPECASWNQTASFEFVSPFKTFDPIDRVIRLDSSQPLQEDF